MRRCDANDEPRLVLRDRVRRIPARNTCRVELLGSRSVGTSGRLALRRSEASRTESAGTGAVPSERGDAVAVNTLALIPGDFWLQRHLVANTNAKCQTCLGEGFLEHGCFEMDCWACDGSGKAGRRRRHLQAVGSR
jgi:hypothetical protein